MVTLPKVKIVCEQRMPLADFIEQRYVPRLVLLCPKLWTHRAGRLRVKLLAKLARLMSIYLRRPAVVADVMMPDTVAGFVAWWERMNPCDSTAATAREAKTLLRAMRWVPDGRATGSGRKPRRVLSDDEGTLWQICRDEYFSKNRRIRTEKTRHQYRLALADFRDAIGREPTMDDLTDDNLIVFSKHLEARKVAEKTNNERVGRVAAMWNWLFRRGRIKCAPDFQRLPCPRRIPRAWKPDELARLFASCLMETGEVVEGITSIDWWFSLHSAIYDCGERIGAMLQARWSMYDHASGLLELPAEVRKGRTADMLHPFHADTRLVLERMRAVGHELIWPWPFSEQQLYRRYNRILRRAGLDAGRKSKFHKMRRTTATYLQARGIDAGLVLGHSDPRVTRDSYLDVTQIVQRRVCDVLPRPRELIVENLPAPVPRLEYKPAEPELDQALAWI